MVEISCTLKSGLSKLDYYSPAATNCNNEGIYSSGRADNIVMQNGNVFKEPNMYVLLVENRALILIYIFICKIWL